MRNTVRIICNLQFVLVSATLLATGVPARADNAQLGNMQADKILFLGNSITACPQTETSLWGLSASTPAKDYAHLLVGKINTATGANLTMLPTTMPLTNPDGSIAQGGSNVVNIADVFERGYASYGAWKIATQLNWRANIVVLQFGENMVGGNYNETVFTNSLRLLMNDLKQSGNPHIFVTSWIMGEPDGVDDIKRELCAEDPTHRVFVDLTSVCRDLTNVGAYSHPNDKGMATIADLMFQAMVAHATPEPAGLVLLSMAWVAVPWYIIKKRAQQTEGRENVVDPR
jgi:hypothetical protein